ncbi:MAG TPA: CHASE3 domain-containing protein [Dongiaceae bacterium]|nr:CHASE3 domain-containing protein [Dongiaceae bacterium]
MFGNWTFGKRLAVGFSLAGIILILIVGAAYRNTSALIENDDWVDHTSQVRLALAELLSDFTDAETGQRGYIITGDESYLEPYQAALTSIKSVGTKLKDLTKDNDRQQRRLSDMQAPLDAKVAELKQTVDLRRSQGFDAAEKVVSTGQGKSYMDQIRSIIAEADAEEASLLKERSDTAHNSAAQTMGFILWGGFLGVVAIGLIGWFMTATLSKQIGSAVGRVQSSSAELQASANQQATTAKEQTTAMNEITTTISELLATSRQIAESAQRVAQTAEKTAGAARGGHGTVDTTQESILGIRRQVDQIVAHMLELGKKSQEIGSVLDIVSELAEQTNILAINATIEAAGAGESGKRFAVVADEIRKLADRVGGATKEIRTLIDDVRSAVNTTVMATETGSKSVDAGARQFGEVAQAFKQIAGLVTTTTEAAREIELSTKQQTTAVEQVNIAIASVAQASVETETSASQTLTTVSLLADLSRDMLRIIRPHLAS